MKLFNPVVLGCLAILAISPAVQAAWTSIDDFQSYSPGTTISGSHGWTTPDDGAIVGADHYLAVADPVNPSNQALQVTTVDQSTQQVGYNNSPSFAIADGTTATVFGRVMFPTMANDALDACVFGLSSSATNPHFGSTLKAYASVDGSALALRNGGSNVGAFTPVKDTWYSLWFVTNNLVSGDNYDVYVQGGTGVYADRTQIATGYTFRGGDTSLLQTFCLETDGDAGTPSVGVFYFDDLNVDSSGQNLTSPVPQVPEPATLGLLAVGGIAALIRRKR